MVTLDALGLNPNDEDFTWERLALCDGMPTNWFYDDYESNETTAKQVDEVCLHCPVMAICANVGRSNKEYGVWGSIYWNGSGKPDKNRNAHKTPEVWTSIREMIQQ